jgi:hypothetical protein
MRFMTTQAVSRIVLVGTPREERDPKIRRYRLARLKLEAGERPRDEDRYAHLKRLYD